MGDPAQERRGGDALERREVRSADPSLSPEANRVLTQEPQDVVGRDAVVSLATGSWWFLLLALGLHALGVMAVVAVVLAMTTETEHLSPSAAARLEDEGVSDPDRLLSDLVEEFAPGDRGGDERETPAHEDPAQAAAEQRSSVTPSQEGSRPVGP